MKRAVACTITYEARDASGARVSGDAANHTLYFSKDGATPVSPTNSPSEIAANSGIYKITLTASETNFPNFNDQGLITLYGTSSTPGVVIPAVQLEFNYIYQTILSLTSALVTPTSLIDPWAWTPRNEILAPNYPLIADVVWSRATRTLTASPTDISGVATASAVETLSDAVDAITARMPSTGTLSTLTTTDLSDAVSGISAGSGPTAAEVATAVWGETTRTLTASPTDISGVATASAVETLSDAVDAITARMPSTGTLSTLTTTDLSDAVSGISAGSGPTAAEVATAVWDATITGYNTSAQGVQAGDVMNFMRDSLDSGSSGVAADITSIMARMPSTGTLSTLTTTDLSDAVSGISAGSGPTAAEVATAVWGETTRTLTSNITASLSAEDILAIQNGLATSSALTSLSDSISDLPEDLWNYETRTLTDYSYENTGSLSSTSISGVVCAGQVV